MDGIDSLKRLIAYTFLNYEHPAHGETIQWLVVVYIGY